MQAEHVPVLAGLAAKIILKKDAVVVDATAGCGGHSKIFADSLGKDAVLICLDVDENSLSLAKENLAETECKTLFIRENFAAIADVLTQNNIEKADLVFADLGVCSVQLADNNKGLSFNQNMKLDMRLDDRLNITAADIVNSRDETELAKLI